MKRSLGRSKCSNNQPASPFPFSQGLNTQSSTSTSPIQLILLDLHRPCLVSTLRYSHKETSSYSTSPNFITRNSSKKRKSWSMPLRCPSCRVPLLSLQVAQDSLNTRCRDQEVLTAVIEFQRPSSLHLVAPILLSSNIDNPIIQFFYGYSMVIHHAGITWQLITS